MRAYARVGAHKTCLHSILKHTRTSPETNVFLTSCNYSAALAQQAAAAAAA